MAELIAVNWSARPEDVELIRRLKKRMGMAKNSELMRIALRALALKEAVPFDDIPGVDDAEDGASEEAKTGTEG